MSILSNSRQRRLFPSGQIIYVVFGSTGAFSDRDDWPILATETEAEAQEFVQRLSDATRTVGLTESGIASSGYESMQQQVDQLNSLIGLEVAKACSYSGLVFFYAPVKMGF